MLSLIRPTIMGAAAPISSRIAIRQFTASSIVAKKKVIDPTLPVPPKGPPSAYTLFFKEFVLNPSNQERNAEGKLDVKVLAAAAGKAWSELQSTAKSEYETQASSLRKEYEGALRKFWESTTPETRAEIERATGKTIKPPGGKRAYKKTIAQREGNPGKPLTPYFAFAQEIRDSNRVTIPDNITSAEKLGYVAKETGKLWKELSEEAQQKYKDTYAAAKEKWEAWKVTQKDL
ncbi:uncharacterized protein I303_104571 [Kwoniella dejecticola CBS 10117]|uniref:HMG box domain-containing protein n=1 Tax=Kwoniella dejecticola CBS 10117 TaxID=1296121 RepID=A0A1A6A4Y4_9TREE|nr:uncharacterized protein I303_04452 [Kwoniella dejecticola CBS 10117]OBR85121.1 hypothetical protein I303_04452 [Kwoniella dejecticola CBS 10117]